ncbi:hypothetical protein ACOMHN_018914 [Nucella lapillus]
MVPPFLQPHPDLQSAVGNAPLSSKHPTHLPTTDCLLSITPLMGGQPSDAPALSPPSPLQQGGQSSNAPALSPPSPLPQDGQPSDAPGLSPSSSTLLLCPSDSTLSICHLNSQSAVKTGVHSQVIYPNGISCTMPEEQQVRLVRAIPGLEKCHLIQPGYGVEYDFMDPRQLRPSLETLPVQHLFFAGQINGTTGYEEAAAQGIVAGINAALKARGRAPFIVDRTQGYVGVLVDDLTTQGTSEPYRMFTSRAEFRLALRPDNADTRLTQLGHSVGCVGEARYQQSVRMKNGVEENLRALQTFSQPVFRWRRQLDLRDNPNPNQMTALEVLSHPDVTLITLVDRYPDVFGHLRDTPDLLERVEIEAKYHVELKQQMEEIEEVRQEEQLRLPDDLDYFSLNMSTDAKVKLAEAKPASIAAASRIPGITPAAIVILLRHVKYRHRPLVTSP